MFISLVEMENLMNMDERLMLCKLFGALGKWIFGFREIVTLLQKRDGKVRRESKCSKGKLELSFDVGISYFNLDDLNV